MSDAVSNASPLIILAKADLLRILPALFTRVILPQAVLDEIQAGPPDDPMKRLLPDFPWLIPVQLSPPISPLSTWQAGAGEAEVIEYSRLNGKLPVLLDDRAARRAAEALGIKVYGTLGLVAAATRIGQVKSFADGVTALKRAGLYLSETLVSETERKLRSGG